MKQTSKRLTSILLSLGFAIIALVVLFELIEPEYANVMMLKGEIVGEQTFLASEKTAVTQAQQLISQYQNQNQTQGQETTSVALPSATDLAGALAQIYGIAQNNGITLQSIGISGASLQPESGTASASDSTDTLAQILKPIGQIQFQLSIAGSYETLKSFLAGLEDNIRIFDVNSLSISAGQASTGGATTGKTAAPAAPQDFFTYNITVTTYYQAP